MLMLTLPQPSFPGCSLSATCQIWFLLHHPQAATAGCHDPSCSASDVHLQVRPQWAAGLPTRGKLVILSFRVEVTTNHMEMSFCCVSSMRLTRVTVILALTSK